MKRVSISLLALAVTSIAASASALASYSTGFETDQTSSFTIGATTADTVSNFSFDYSTYVPTAPTAGITTIPVAPSAAGTKALKLAANVDATGTTEAISAFVNAGTGISRYTLQFDCFQMWNGDAVGGGTGTTQSMVCGDAATTAVAWQNSANFSGEFFTITHEGGSGTDLRYYEGNGTAAAAANNALPNWFGTNATANTATEWVALFPTPTYSIAGAPGRVWNTWQMTVDGSLITIKVKPNGAASFTQVSAFSASAAASLAGNPFVGAQDTFASIADPAVDNFVLIDNLSFNELAAPTSADSSWSAYN